MDVDGVIIIDGTDVCVCDHTSWDHVLYHERCYLCGCGRFEKKEN